MFRVQTVTVVRWVLIFIDDHTRMRWVYLLLSEIISKNNHMCWVLQKTISAGVIVLKLFSNDCQYRRILNMQRSCPLTMTTPKFQLST